MKEQYNAYSESLNIDCSCNNKKISQQNNNCGCGGVDMSSHDNTIKILIKQLQREVKNLMKTTQAKLLCQDKQIAECCTYIKNNLSNYLRELLDSMIQSGEMEQIIKDIILDNVSDLNNRIANIEQSVDNLTQNQINLYNNLDTKINANLNKINNNTNRIENLEVQRNKLVVFGDSWSDLTVSDAIWSTTLANKLNLVNKNYAVNGAGFIAPNNNLISSQITRFKNDLLSETIQAKEIAYIIVMGGINDYKNNISASVLLEKIKTDLDSIRAVAPDSKIVYISNCEYPYTSAQMTYWYTIHNGVLNYNTYNLMNKIGLPLFNSTYFHLTQVGQIWLAKNIQAILTGGSIHTYFDMRELEDENVKIQYSTIPLTDNSVEINVAVYIKRALESNVLEIADAPNIPYGGTTGLFGTVGTGFKKAVVDTTPNSITFAVDSQAYQDSYFYLKQILYTQNT